MPKELTHWLLAERALAGLEADSRLLNTIRSHKNEYLGGAVLPDTLLHLFRGAHAKQALSAAGRFHDTAGNSFQPLIDAEKALGGQIDGGMSACLLGVISHMLADMVFHPYVYALSGKGDIGRHYQLETDLDVFFMNHAAAPVCSRLRDIADEEAADTLVTAAGLLFVPEGELSAAAVRQALDLHIRFQSMYSSTFWKLAARLLGAVLGKPFSQQRHLFYPLINSVAAVNLPHKWRHPVTGRWQQKSVEQLAAETVAKTVELFKQIESAGSFAAALSEIPGTNLLTGMYGVVGDRMIEF